ncbi:patatin-like phospholipase family protein [Radiobacillus kanasensis]|uniref:patatin-like phospholipase family protein n=1 Tax=Radiobacillus kanasensis TaxID=2844358 RepID=UPI001E2DCCF1|nr:patatin-like phospholipase family protein [Radiobacillus kanasensis]UFU00923.1 patatin-like phospholipase family protein [Radiobacillus kanasensis]
MAKPVIGLALGSGGAKGLSHIGVIKELEDHGISIDLIAGSSIGAVIGVLYAAGQKPAHLIQIASSLKRNLFVDFAISKMGIIQGERIKEFIQLLTFNQNLEDLKIPVGVVATELYTGRKKVFRKGFTADVVRASISIPGIFVPENMQGTYYIDGGVVDRVPVSVAREMGADIVIAVDCSAFSPNSNVYSMYDVMLQSIDIMQEELVQHIPHKADIVLKPEVFRYHSRSFKDATQIIKEGREEAKAKLRDIQDIVTNWKEKNHEI